MAQSVCTELVRLKAKVEIENLNIHNVRMMRRDIFKRVSRECHYERLQHRYQFNS